MDQHATLVWRIAKDMPAYIMIGVVCYGVPSQVHRCCLPSSHPSSHPSSLPLTLWLFANSEHTNRDTETQKETHRETETEIDTRNHEKTETEIQKDTEGKKEKQIDKREIETRRHREMNEPYIRPCVHARTRARVCVRARACVTCPPARHEQS